MPTVKTARIIAILFMLSLSLKAGAQVINLASFDERPIHFGIQIGYTQSKFDLHYTDDPEVRELLQSTKSYYNAGFHLAILADYQLYRYINIRVSPGITLINRSLDFAWDETYQQGHLNLDTRRSVESVYGEIPVDLKFRAMRWRNMRPYLTTGVSYGFDFASLRNNKNQNDQSIIRLNTSDFRYSAGVGFDFYLRYVRFAIELKMAFGLTDLKIEDDDTYARSFDNLNTRTFMLGFIFEG